jgi:hypothetical protein
MWLVVSDVVIFLSSIVVLPINGQYLDYAPVAYSERYFCKVTVITKYGRPLKTDLFIGGLDLKGACTITYICDYRVVSGRFKIVHARFLNAP